MSERPRLRAPNPLSMMAARLYMSDVLGNTIAMGSASRRSDKPRRIGKIILMTQPDQAHEPAPETRFGWRCLRRSVPGAAAGEAQRIIPNLNP